MQANPPVAQQPPTMPRTAAQVTGLSFLAASAAVIGEILAINTDINADGMPEIVITAAILLAVAAVSAFAHRRNGGGRAAAIGVGAVGAAMVLGWWALYLLVGLLFIFPPGN